MIYNKLLSLALLTTLVFLSGCSENEGDEGATSTVQGWHQQGRDCLACHNVDLNPDKHLLYGGTLYKQAIFADQNDLTKMCGGKLIVNFYNSSTGVLEYSSADYEDPNSKGYDAKGNIFILQRELRLLTADNYNVQITTANGTQLAIGTNHRFNSADYDIGQPIDYQNRLSCNSCHSKTGTVDPLNAGSNSSLCE